MRKVTLLMIFFIVCTAFTACSYKDSPPTAVQKPDNGQTEKDEIHKYNAYVDLHDYIAYELTENMNDYFKQLGRDQEPTFKKNFSFVPPKVSSYDKEAIEKAFKVSSRQPQYPTVDTALQELYPHMTELMNLLAEAHTYYELKSYIDDNYTKAKELHAKIVTCYNTYQPLAEKYCTNFNIFATERVKANLDSYKSKEQLFRYYCLHALVSARVLEQELEAQQITAANVLDLDLPKFQEKYNLLLADINELTKYANQEQAKKEGIENFYPYPSYIDEIVEVKASAAELLQRVQTRHSFEWYELGDKFFRENEDGAPEKFSRKLRNAIRSYHRLNRY